MIQYTFVIRIATRLISSLPRSLKCDQNDEVIYEILKLIFIIIT